MLLLAAAFLLIAMTVDGLLRSPGDADYRLLRALRLEGPGVATLVEAFSLAGSLPALAAVTYLALAGLIVRRNWLGAVMMAAVPVAGVATVTLTLVIAREAPQPAVVDISLGGSAGQYGLVSPAITVALTLYGLIATVYAPSLRGHFVPGAARAAALVAPVGIAYAALWQGEAWPSTVVGSAAIALLVVAAAATAYRSMAPTMSGIPLVHATYIDTPGERSAHALTSTILFRGATAWKIYAPGFVPRFIYWLAFQAPFAYAHNPVALQAAVARRNLAGKLTEYWFGTNCVARALGIETYEGRLALVSEFVVGHEPVDHGEARRKLLELASYFDRAGLPTWQIDPRQPRSLGNVMEGADGRFTIIDLESGLVSPVASPRAWWRAVRRAEFPFYDDVAFGVTRDYIARERETMRLAKGDVWLAELDELLDETERATMAWHASEPRIWSRLLRGLWSGFGVLGFPRWMRGKMHAGEAHATVWMNQAIDDWEREGRVSAGEAASLRASLSSPDIQAVLPHLGVHLIIGMALRFPIGSITRASYTLGNLLLSTGRLAIRRIDRRRWRRDFGIHSPLVIFFAAMPGVGTFAYLASWPILSHRGLIRVAADAVGDRLPAFMYRKRFLKRIVARPVRHPAGRRAPGAGQGG
jgi:hypothetical protein